MLPRQLLENKRNKSAVLLMNVQALRLHLSASLPAAATGKAPKITFHFQLRDENRFQESVKRFLRNCSWPNYKD